MNQINIDTITVNCHALISISSSVINQLLKDSQTVVGIGTVKCSMFVMATFFNSLFY